MHKSGIVSSCCRKSFLLGIIVMVATMYFLVPVKLSSAIVVNSAVAQKVLPAVAELTTVEVSSTQHLQKLLTTHDYNFHQLLDRDRGVPRLHCTNFPKDLGNVKCLRTKQSLFIQVLLPMVLNANEEILRDRKQLIAIKVALEAGEVLISEQNQWLSQIAARYKMSNLDIDGLINRVDIVPISMALGQAIIESGWGLSYAAREKNSPFGMTISDKVKNYSCLLESVVSYVHNLNTNRAYWEMRHTRASLRSKGKVLDGYTLIGDLRRYSEQRALYIRKVRFAIKHHDLTKFDTLQLQPMV